MKTIVVKIAVVGTTALLAAPALAQEGSPSGPYLGVGVTAVDHHFVLEETTGSTTTRRNVTQWGVGGAAFAGYNGRIGRSLIAGVEGAYLFGGKTAATRTSGGAPVGFDPRWGFSVAARLGYEVAPGTLVYVKGGYGEHHYRLVLPAGASSGDSTTASFVLGGGVEHRIGRNLSARLEFEHLDGSRNQFMLGFPIRF
ncbi:MAG: porin family protein [Alphaproteobacteria bacterium]|nr:porin family protein [Alphaproteobacteria bacterium]MBV9371713.1 porin family protein [Alphaproteobacteria bacterium]MBV9902489.1 porin family protein [Alphaproteobacteria bacterium]